MAEIIDEFLDCPRSPDGAHVFRDKSLAAERAQRGGARRVCAQAGRPLLLGFEVQVSAELAVDLAVAIHVIPRHSSTGDVMTRAIAWASRWHFECSVASCCVPAGVRR